MADYVKPTGGMPTDSAVLVNTDQVTILGDGSVTDPLRTAAGGVGGQFTGVAQATIEAGQAIQHHSGASPIPPPVGLCVGDAAVQCLGLAIAGAANGADVKVQYDGVLTLTTAQWDAIAGTSGGLAGGIIYYVSQSTAGDLTSTAPTTGQHSIQVGVGLNSTQMFLTISPPTIAP